jgi:hypothetical protein
MVLQEQLKVKSKAVGGWLLAINKDERLNANALSEDAKGIAVMRDCGSKCFPRLLPIVWDAIGSSSGDCLC